MDANRIYLVEDMQETIDKLQSENQRLRELVRTGVELAIGPDTEEHSIKVLDWAKGAEEVLSESE